MSLCQLQIRVSNTYEGGTRDRSLISRRDAHHMPPTTAQPANIDKLAIEADSLHSSPFDLANRALTPDGSSIQHNASCHQAALGRYYGRGDGNADTCSRALWTVNFDLELVRRVVVPRRCDAAVRGRNGAVGPLDIAGMRRDVVGCEAGACRFNSEELCCLSRHLVYHTELVKSIED